MTLAGIPPDIARDWVAHDGDRTLYRVEANEKMPDGAQPDNLSGALMAPFVNQIRSVAPNAGGSVVSIMSTTHTILSSFRHAATYAVVAIGFILLVSLRRLLDAGAILASLLLSAATTVLVSVLLPLPLNFANIIALPLLLGLGVAFKIYFVMAWRAGTKKLLQSSLTRAVFWSALTTATAFGSLWASKHPGTSSMGKLMALSLLCTLAAAILFQPALMGPPRKTEVR